MRVINSYETEQVGGASLNDETSSMTHVAEFLLIGGIGALAMLTAGVTVVM